MPYTPNAYGLVPVRIKKDDAGAGLIAGEVRGVSPEVARAMVETFKSAELVSADEKDAAAAAEVAAAKAAEVAAAKAAKAAAKVTS